MSAAEAPGAFQVETEVVPPLDTSALVGRLRNEVARAFEPRDWHRTWDMERERSYAQTILRHDRTPLAALATLSHLRVCLAHRGYNTGTSLGDRLASIATNFAVVADETTRADVRRRIAAQDVW
jgi:hypothetical protein